MIGSKDIFERLEKYDSKLTHSMYELFIAKQQASVNLLQAQTEAVKSLPKASEREYIITTRGQWFGLCCIIVGLAVSVFMAWNGYIKTAGVIAMAALAPNIISTIITPRINKQETENKK